MNRMSIWAASALFAMVSYNAAAAEPAQCQKQSMGIVGWTDVVAISGMAAALLEELGYEVSESTASQQIVFAGIERGQIDFFLGYWSPAMDNNIKPFLDRGVVKVADRPNLPDAVSTLAVPSYAAEQGLKTFADIARFKDQLDGKIYGIEVGSGANAAIQKMIDSNQFGLGGFKLIESSEAAMLAAVSRAQRQKKPIVFFGWKPHPMNLQIQMTYLTGSENVFGPNEGSATVSNVTDPKLAQRCPNVARLLENLSFTTEQEGQWMQPIMDREKPRDVARKWLKQNPQALDAWLAGVTNFDGQDGATMVKARLK
ncbi:choline ABC transporter substrate-binding protein [Pseudomonas sp. LRF_L74]|uniref:choline ABC transporter substrate-binding protein n=1 Tax=Pseudomonas sp. LRF_L74 TaxID=3369422 RepID=UPI003F638B3F